MPDRYFTLDEAERLIPRLEMIVTSMMEHRKSALLIGEELSALQERIHAGENVMASELINKRTELDFIVQIVQEGLEEIENLGAQPKDLDIGLVDFPAMIDGEEILLCWKFGEKSIRFYHGLTDGYTGRKPIKIS
jgi:hypothetical protein